MTESKVTRILAGESSTLICSPPSSTSLRNLGDRPCAGTMMPGMPDAPLRRRHLGAGEAVAVGGHRAQATVSPSLSMAWK